MQFSVQTERYGRRGSAAARIPPWLPAAGVLALPVTFWVGSLMLAFAKPWIFKRLAIEDGPIEDAQALVLLGCGLIAARIAWLLHQRESLFWSLAYGVLAAGIFWIAGEEISWGQRIFGLTTPEVLASNIQNETNLHNLPGVMSTLSYIMLSGVWIAIVLSITTSFWSAARKTRWRTGLWVPSPFLIPAWLCFISYSFIRSLDLWWRQTDQVQRIVSMAQEPAELILYAGILAFLTMVLIRIDEQSPTLRDRP